MSAHSNHRGGVKPQTIALRDAIRIYLWQHLNKYPQLWFSEPELGRVLMQQYLCTPAPVSHGAYHHGHVNAITRGLRWLAERGEAECQQDGRRRLWQARQPHTPGDPK